MSQSRKISLDLQLYCDDCVTRAELGASRPCKHSRHSEHSWSADERRVADHHRGLVVVRYYRIHLLVPRTEVEPFSNFRDRVRTSINVLGDAFAACIVSHYLKGRLDESDKHNEFHAEIREEIGKCCTLLNLLTDPQSY